MPDSMPRYSCRVKIGISHKPHPKSKTTSHNFMNKYARYISIMRKFTSHQKMSRERMKSNICAQAMRFKAVTRSMRLSKNSPLTTRKRRIVAKWRMWLRRWNLLVQPGCCLVMPQPSNSLTANKTCYIRRSSQVRLSTNRVWQHRLVWKVEGLIRNLNRVTQGSPKRSNSNQSTMKWASKKSMNSFISNTVSQPSCMQACPVDSPSLLSMFLIPTNSRMIMMSLIS